MTQTIDLQQIVVGKALRNDAYRQELLRDPRAVVERELKGLSNEASLPADVEIRVIEEGADETIIVLPKKLGTAPENTGSSLTDGRITTPAVTWMWDPCACL